VGLTVGISSDHHRVDPAKEGEVRMDRPIYQPIKTPGWKTGFSRDW
jgi:hypothetical protein